MTWRRTTDGLAVGLLLVAGWLLIFRDNRPGTAVPPEFAASAGPELVPMLPLLALTMGLSALVLLAGRLPGAVTVSRPVAAVLVLVGGGALVWDARDLARRLASMGRQVGESFFGQIAQAGPPLAEVAGYTGLTIAVVLGLARGGRAASGAGGAAVAWGGVLALGLAVRLADNGPIWFGIGEDFLDVHLEVGGPLMPAAAFVLVSWGAVPATGPDAVRDRWRGAAAALAVLAATAAAGFTLSVLGLDGAYPVGVVRLWLQVAVLWLGAGALALAAARWESAVVPAIVALAAGVAGYVIPWTAGGVTIVTGWFLPDVLPAIVPPLAVAAGAWWTSRPRTAASPPGTGRTTVR